MAISGELAPEQFRQWLMSNMLSLESIDDSDILDLVFGLENLGYQFQHGDFDDAGFVDRIQEMWANHNLKRMHIVR